MQTKTNLSGGKKITLIVLGALTALGLLIELISAIRYRADYTYGSFLAFIGYAVTSVLLLQYALAGYKVPHGNALRYLFLLFALVCLVGIVSVVGETTKADAGYNTLRGVVVILSAYVAGRLDHFKENVIIMSVIGVLMLISSIIISADFKGFFGGISCFTFFILWVDLMIAYILRYKEHKEAGLTDR